MDDFNFSLMWANKQCEYASFLHIVFHNQQQNASSLDSYVFLISVLLLFFTIIDNQNYYCLLPSKLFSNIRNGEVIW